MYNEEQKERFLKDMPVAKPWFEKSESYEEEYGRDLYDFSVPEVLEFYKMLFTPSLDRLMVVNNILEKYGSFALKNTLIADGQNHFAEITMPMLAGCIDHRGSIITTRAELKKITDQLLNPLDVYLFWALFDGLKGKDYCEVTELEWNKIDLEHKTVVLCTGRKVKLSDELIMYAKESFDTNTYRAYVEDPDDEKNQQLRPMIGDVWKVSTKKNTADTPERRGRQCYHIINRCLKYLGMPTGFFSGKHLWDSGVMDMAKRIAEEQNIPIKEVFYSHYDELNAQYRFTKQMRSNYLLKYKQYIEEED